MEKSARRLSCRAVSQYLRDLAFPIGNRHVIRDLIGEEAEFLVYVFWVTERPQAFLAQAGSSEIELKDHYADRLVRLTPVQLNQLLEVEAANLLEQGSNVWGMLQQLLATGISPAAKARIITSTVSRAANPQRAQRQ